MFRRTRLFNDTCRRYGQKSEKMQHKPGARRSLTQGNYRKCHNQVASIFHQELPNKCGISKGKPTPFYKFEPYCVLEQFIL
jgi:hypothetical protein